MLNSDMITPMIIHFICRGNAFRSRMAGAYLNSLELDGLKAISSGTVAKQHSESNKANFLITQSVLEEHGLKKFTKAHWDQLNKKRLLEGDLTVFLNKNVEKECQKLFGLPDNYIVWDIPDFDEISPIPTTKAEIHVFTERTYSLIVSKINNLSDYLLR